MHRQIHAVTAATALTPLVESFVGLLTDVSTDLAGTWAGSPVGAGQRPPGEPAVVAEAAGPSPGGAPAQPRRRRS